jgi:hypothetical protein
VEHFSHLGRDPFVLCRSECRHDAANMTRYAILALMELLKRISLSDGGKQFVASGREEDCLM